MSRLAATRSDANGGEDEPGSSLLSGSRIVRYSAAWSVISPASAPLASSTVPCANSSGCGSACARDASSAVDIAAEVSVMAARRDRFESSFDCSRRRCAEHAMMMAWRVVVTLLALRGAVWTLHPRTGVLVGAPVCPCAMPHERVEARMSINTASVWSTYILPKRHDLGFENNDGVKCKQRAVPGPGPSDANNAVEVKADDQAAAERKAFYY